MKQSQTMTIATQQRWILAVLGVFCTSVFVYPGFMIFDEPYLLNYTEGILLHAARQVLHGGSLYQPLDAPPYNYFAYGPLHSYLGAGIMWLLGEDVLALRWLTVLAELAIVICVYRIVRLHDVSRPYALLGAALAVAVLGMHKFHMIARVDLPALAFEFAGLVAFFAYLRHGRRRYLVFFSLAMIVALLGKVTTAIILACVGLCGLMALRRGRRHGLAIVAACVAAGLGYGLVALLWNIRSQGAFFAFQVTYQGASSFCDPTSENCRHVWLLFKQIGGRYGSFMVFVLLGAWLARGRRHGHARFFALSAAAWLCWALFKDGSDLNYTLEFLILLCIVAGLSLPDWYALLARARVGGRAIPAAVSLSAVLLVALSSPLGSGYAVRDWHARGWNTQEDLIAYIEWMGGDPATMDSGPYMDLMSDAARDDRRKLAEFMAQASGIVLSEEPFFAAAAGKELWLVDPFQAQILEEGGYFDGSPIVNACREGRIRWVFAGWRLLRIDGLPEVLDAEFEPIFKTRTAAAGSSFWTVYRRR